MTLLYLAFAWLAGICLASLFSLPFWLWVVWILFGTGVAIWWREHPLIRISGVSLIFLVLGALRYQSALPTVDEKALAFHNDRGSAAWEGTVIAEPIRRERSMDLRVEARRIQVDDSWRDAKGLALVRVPRLAEYQYGDLLLIEGELETPPEFPDFSWRDYLAKQGMVSIVRYPDIEVLAHDQGNPLYSSLLDIKDRAHFTIQNIFPEPEAALLSGILLGLDSEIPADLLDAFNRTNTRHIIAISGFNITILSAIFFFVGERLFGKRKRVYFALAGIAIYTLLVGASPSVVRAAIMGGLYILALHFGRQSLALISLGVAAWLMTLANPLLLRDVGFQLSFLSTIGLILHGPQVMAWWQRQWAGWSPPGIVSAIGTVLGQAVLITAVAQIWVYPIMVATFHQVSLISILANALIVPVQWGVMVLGGSATLLGMIYLPLGQIVGWFAWPFAAWTTRAAEILAQFPEASISVAGFDIILATIFYAFLLLSAYAWPKPEVMAAVTRRLSPTPRLLFGSTLVLANILAVLAIAQLPDGRWHIAFLDVGQGDSILIQSPSGQRVLVDGGPGFSSATAELGPLLPFWDRYIDLVVLSHPQADHFTGLLSVLERYSVGSVLYPEITTACSTLICERFFEILEEKNIPRREAEAGMGIRTAEGIVLEVLSPPERLPLGTGADVNNSSVVMRLSVGSVSILLTSDIESEAEQALVAGQSNLDSLILKVAHHGSATSTTYAFLQAVSPRLAVISVGEGNPFGHPSKRTVDRLSPIPVLCTDKHGTIELISDGERLWLKVERPSAQSCYTG